MRNRVTKLVTLVSSFKRSRCGKAPVI